MSITLVEPPGRHHIYAYASGDLPDDLEQVDPATSFLAFRVPIRSRQLLATFRRATAIWALNADEAVLHDIASLAAVQRLYLIGTSAADLSAIERLSRLETLVVHQAPKLTSLTTLAGLRTLTALNLYDLRRVRSLEPLTALQRLEVLAVEGGWTTPPMKVDSLGPLAGLSQLVELHLTALRVTDTSLRALHGLTRLKRLDIVGTFPTEEYARLAARLPDVACSWLAPFVVVPGATCDRCGGRRLILTGKRGTVCEGCDAGRVRKHTAHFERIRSETC